MKTVKTLTMMTPLALAIPAIAAGGDKEAKRPNIIVILADDMGYSDIGCYGGEIETPNIDGLASEGLRWRLFYNNARSCPSRACLLTGLYPHQAGMGWMAAATWAESRIRDISTGTASPSPRSSMKRDTEHTWPGNGT